MATTVGSGSYQYELNESWARLPTGRAWGQVSAVASDSQDRVYAFQRKDPPVVVFDRDGNYLTSWGHSAIRDPHGIAIVDDLVYLTDRDDHVALKFTLDGKPLILGTRGKPSDTGATKDIELPPRSAGPFSKPTQHVRVAIETAVQEELHAAQSAVSRVIATLKDGLEAWRTCSLADLDVTFERLHEEFRRRVNKQGSLASEDASIVLLFSLVASGQIKLRRIAGSRKIASVVSQPTPLAP